MAKAQTPHLNSKQRARVLDKALGWMCKFRGDVVVIEYSDHTIADPNAQEAFASDIQFLQHVGMFSVAVHGGGPQVSVTLDKLGVETPFHGGVCITAPKAMGIVRTALTGQVQYRLASRLNQRGSPTVGISGEDRALFSAKHRTGVDEEGEEIGFGLVNEVANIGPSAVLGLLDTRRIPVISSITIDRDNARRVPNINADVAASALAVALGASKLLILTDAEGVYSGYLDPDSLLYHTTPSQLRTLGNAASSGIIPKVRACLQAIEGGIDAVHVVDERQVYSVLIEVMTDESTSTIVVPDSAEGDV